VCVCAQSQSGSRRPSFDDFEKVVFRDHKYGNEYSIDIAFERCADNVGVVCHRSDDLLQITHPATFATATTQSTTWFASSVTRDSSWTQAVANNGANALAPRVGGGGGVATVITTTSAPSVLDSTTPTSIATIGGVAINNISGIARAASNNGTFAQQRRGAFVLL
jgi:hypothetical protein